MSLGRMCGVVLWANPDDQKAVVWCEDQGNLAFYLEPQDTALSGVALDAGDLIEFELREEPQFRRVTNPTLLVQDHAPELVAKLGRCANSAGAASAGTEAGSSKSNSNVVPFPRARDWAQSLSTPQVIA
ncbi:hypothetical protein [Marinovum sp.]|uniref:hypothetical protein n=1 Tax=Marinovum sp. TaxID=2024839 RepID=UPI002B275B75|nr:hypothetical protein [Marinovum sp.]